MSGLTGFVWSRRPNRIKKYAVSKVSGFVWMGPKLIQLFRRYRCRLRRVIFPANKAPPNLVPRSHSVFHWKVRSPFPLAVGDLGTRLGSTHKMTNCTPRAVVNSVLRNLYQWFYQLRPKFWIGLYSHLCFYQLGNSHPSSFPHCKEDPGRDHKIPNENRPISLLRAHSNAKCAN